MFESVTSEHNNRGRLGAATIQDSKIANRHFLTAVLVTSKSHKELSYMSRNPQKKMSSTSIVSKHSH